MAAVTIDLQDPFEALEEFFGVLAAAAAAPAEPMPADLALHIETILADDPALSWDAAMAQVASWWWA